MMNLEQLVKINKYFYKFELGWERNK
jgi:hypothetical protein